MDSENTDTLHRLFGLDGKTALVTGAGGGLGSAITEALAGAGASTMLAGLPGEQALHRTRDALAEQGCPVETIEGDLGDVASAPRLVQATVDRFGSLDILVNCAGINRRQPILEVTPDVYDAIMAVNLRAVYFLCQAAARAMQDRGGGKIINIGSLTSSIGLADVSVYGATKAAIAELTKTMAVEWARHNIQVNCLAPGFMLTSLTREALWGNEQKRRWMLDRIPARRPGLPADLAGAALLLASPASDYLTGQMLAVDGGLLAGSPW